MIDVDRQGPSAQAPAMQRSKVGDGIVQRTNRWFALPLLSGLAKVVVTSVVCGILATGCSRKPGVTTGNREQVIEALSKLHGKAKAGEKYTNWIIAIGPGYSTEAAHQKILDKLHRMEKDPPNRSITNFNLLTTNMTLEQVIDRIGIFDQVRGSGIWHYEYDFPDGSAALVSPGGGLSNATVTINFYKSTNDIQLIP